MEANAKASDRTVGSAWACWARTEWRIWRKRLFSTREEGVGGRVELVPMASEGFGGWVGRSVRM